MVNSEALNHTEIYFPLKVFVCEKCWLVQVDEIERAENIFNDDYTYFSSFSTSWLAHARRYVIEMIERFKYNQKSLIVEIASNDGYLLQYFHEKNIPVLGVEPTTNTALVAKQKGIECIEDFFSEKLVREKLVGKADLILGNNVLAHVPDINDFIKGVKLALKPKGVNTFEFPHLCKLVELKQFDTVYHEHFSYLSFTSLKSVFEKQGLEFFDVQELTTHGGSLRIFTKHIEDKSKQISPSVEALLKREKDLGVKTIEYYQGFQEKVNIIKNEFLSFLLIAKNEGKKVVAYGAAAKGNTLLNYCGIKGNDLIDYVVDASPYKQNRLLPGSRIPVYHPDKLKETKPDYIIILPWNLKEEISLQLSQMRNFGSKFVVAIPELEIF
jgi:SAM-dependent methyltransferase